MFLVQVNTKAKVSALLDSLALPGDAGHNTTQRHACAGGVHLTQVNADAIDLHKDLVSGGPVINLVQSKLNRYSVGLHLFWTRAARDIDCLGHLLAALS